MFSRALWCICFSPIDAGSDGGDDAEEGGDDAENGGDNADHVFMPMMVAMTPMTKPMMRLIRSNIAR